MPFRPGQSGNPSGRPKADPMIREAARAHAEDAIAVFVANLTDESPMIRHKAAEAILDRAYGKPAQAIIGGEEDDPPIRQEARVLIELVRPTSPDG
jgi:hypothetical protein